jgi:glycosyltransferase involved in cell wall biosynthesis
MRVIALPGDLSACGYYRVFAPLAAIERAGLAEVYRPEPVESNGRREVFIRPEILQDFDVAVFQRQPEERITQLFQIARIYGTKVVFDVDDDLFNVPADSPAYTAWGRDWRKHGGKLKVSQAVAIMDGNAGPTDPIDAETRMLIGAARQVERQARRNFDGFIANMRLADLVTVSTDKLRGVYSKHRSDIVVLRNQIEPRDWKDAIADPHDKPDDQVWIGWSGSKTHWSDLDEISRAIEEVLQRNTNARLALVGFPEAAALFERVRDRVIVFDWMPIADYRRVVAAFDVALAPSAALKFNEGKSDIRVLEAALCGLPVVASETTYGDTVREAKCGFVAKSPQKWIKYLGRLVKDASLRSELGENGRRYVLQHRTYDGNAWRWAEAYSKLLEG